MTMIAQATLFLFIVGWFVAAAAWLYGTRFFIPRWAAGFRKREDHLGYRRKALLGYGIFIGAIAFMFLMGGIGQLAGGWE